MASRGMAEFRSNGVDFTINDPNNAGEFSASNDYTVGQYVYYQGNLYRFTSDHAAGAWNANHVTQAKIGADLKAAEDKAYKGYMGMLGENTMVAHAFSTTMDYVKRGISLSFTVASGFYDTEGVFHTYEGIQKAEITGLHEGDAYLLNTRAYYSVAYFMFFDANGKVIRAESGLAAENITNKLIYVPRRAAKLMLQRQGTNTVKLDMITSFVPSVEKEISAIAQRLYTDIPLTFEAKTGFYDPAGNFASYERVDGATVNVVPGERYVLSIQPYLTIAIAVFFDSAGNFVSGMYGGGGDWDYTVNDYNVVVPYRAATMLIQRWYGRSATLKKETGIQPIQYASVLNGKKLTVIGDSITEHNYRATTNWPMYISQWTGASIQNLGVSGSGFANPGRYIDRISSIQGDPDVIGVAMSFNDFSSGLPLGTATDTGDTTIAGYVNDFFTALIAAYPTTPIICYCQGPWYGFHPGTTNGDNYFNLVKAICLAHSVPFYGGLYEGGVLRPWIEANCEVYYKSEETGVVDDVHPNSEGHKSIARYLYPKFEENLVTTGA